MRFLYWNGPRRARSCGTSGTKGGAFHAEIDSVVGRVPVACFLAGIDCLQDCQSRMDNRLEPGPSPACEVLRIENLAFAGARRGYWRRRERERKFDQRLGRCCNFLPNCSQNTLGILRKEGKIYYEEEYSRNGRAPCLGRRCPA